MQGGPLSVGARKEPFVPLHLMFISQTPNVKSFFIFGFGSVTRKATVVHHGEGAREDGRNLRQTWRMRPTFIQRVGLDLRRDPVPRYVPVINTEARRKNWSACMGRQGEVQGSQEEREVFLGIR